MENKSTTITRQLDELQDERSDLKKKKRLWEEYVDEWMTIQREEESLLEEVQYVSQGTISATHASSQLHYFDEEKKEVATLFHSIDDEFEQKEKQLYDQENQLNEQYYDEVKKENKDDEV